MANCLAMAEIHAILSLHQQGRSNREIARLLGLHRDTVARHLRAAGIQNRPNAPSGSLGPDGCSGAVNTPPVPTGGNPLEAPAMPVVPAADQNRPNAVPR